MSKVPEKIVEELNERIAILETLENYLFEAMQINEITARTYTRVTGAIRHKIAYYKDAQRCGKIMPGLTISLEALNKIQDMAKPYEVDVANLRVKPFIDLEEKMLDGYINTVMKRDVHEMIVEDVDKLLAAIAKADKIIDD